MDENKALSKCMHMCSVSEHCEFDIHQKLKSWKIPQDAHQQIIERLYRDNYLNEIRFIKAYVNDKFRFNRWGKNKISFMLKQKAIYNDIVIEALNSIDDNEYINLLKEELAKKIAQTKGKDSFIIKAKVVRYMLSKGFEQELIFKYYNDKVNNC